MTTPFDTVREALTAAECLIEHQYTSTREGMTALQDASDDCQMALKALDAIEANHAHDMASAAAQGYRDGVASVQPCPTCVSLARSVMMDQRGAA